MSNYEFSRKPINVPFVKTKNRLIQTMIPEPNTKVILDTLDKIESRSMHGQLPIIWDKAIDFNVYDKVGNKWIDGSKDNFNGTGFINDSYKSKFKTNLKLNTKGGFKTLKNINKGEELFFQYSKGNTYWKV